MPQALVAAAVAISSAIGGTVAAVTGSVALGGLVADGVFALAGGAGFGAFVSSWAVVGSLAGAFDKPKVGGIADGGTQVNYQANPLAGVPTVLGRTGVGGVIAHMTTDGQARKNAHLLSCVVLTLGPMQALDSFNANAAPVTFDITAAGLDTDYVATSSPFVGAMDLRTQLGLQSNDRFPYPSVPDGDVPEWTDANTLPGLGASWLSLNYSTSAYPTGVPAPIWVVKGPGVYDPRQDSTYPGGSGPQRATDPSTWSFDGYENPFLHGLTFCLGRWSNGVRVSGVGLPVSAIDVEAFVEGANVADANGWKIGGVVTSSDAKWDTLVAMLQAGSGIPMRLGGKVSCVVDTPRVSLRTITGADVIGDPVVTGTKSRQQRFNCVVPQYRSEANNWEISDSAPVVASTYVTEDGRSITKEIPFSLCQDVDQAAQLAAYQIVNAREAEPIVLPLKPIYMGFKAGDCLTVNEPELLLNNQKVIVTGRSVDPSTAAATLTFRTETDAKHPFALGLTGTAPPTPSLTGVDPGFVPAPESGSWDVVETELSNADGTIPAIVLTGAVDAATVASVIVEYREVLGGGMFGAWVTANYPATTTRIEITGLKPNTLYQVRVRYVTVRGFDNTGSVLDLGSHTTGGLVVPADVTTIGGMTVAEFLAAAAATSAQGDQLTQAVLQLAAQAVSERNAMISQTFHNGKPVRKIVIGDTEDFTDGDYSVTHRLNLLGLVIDAGGAFQLDDTTLKVSATETWADYRTGVTANFNSVSASVTSEATSRATADGALASSLSSVSTTVAGHTSSITALSSSLNGLSAEYLLVVNSGTNVASIQAYAGGSLSSIVFTASQIGFTDGSSNVFPLSVSGGVVHATNFEADRVVAGSIVTNSLVGGAVTNVTWDEQTYGSNLTSTPTQVFSTSHTTAVASAPHVINLNATVANGTGDVGVLLTIKRDGTAIAARSFYVQGSFTVTGSFMVFDQPSAAAHTYTIEASKTSGSGSLGDLTVSNMTITELKK